MLSKEQLDKFEKDGFLVIPDFFTKEQATSMLRRSKELLEKFDISTHPMTRFVAEKEEHVGDDYFLESGDKVRFFFETDAFDTNCKLKVCKEQAINKIGHGLHYHDDVFRKFTTQKEIITITGQLGFKIPYVLQSMVICKQPGIGGAVNGHIDSTFLYTQPTSCIGFWFALEDCTKDNGCMQFVPGSHKKFVCNKRFIRNLQRGGTSFISLNDQEEPSDDEYICTETMAGSLVLIHGLVYHKSSYNRSNKSRFIYTFHVIEGQYEYPSDNWLQPSKECPFMNLRAV